MAERFFIETHGCQMNEYDSDKMADVLRGAFGATATQNAGEADIVIVNTCSVREKAQEKVFSLLGRCHGMPAWQKNTGIPVVSATVWWWHISLPWSQVSDRRSGSGRSPKIVTSWSRKLSARDPPSRCTRIV